MVMIFNKNMNVYAFCRGKSLKDKVYEVFWGFIRFIDPFAPPVRVAFISRRNKTMNLPDSLHKFFYIFVKTLQIQNPEAKILKKHTFTP
jgi:hypothetical protein